MDIKCDERQTEESPRDFIVARMNYFYMSMEIGNVPI